MKGRRGLVVRLAPVFCLQYVEQFMRARQAADNITVRFSEPDFTQTMPVCSLFAIVVDIEH